jgi:predicted anti-sigma-YlaC factor YlaD
MTCKEIQENLPEMIEGEPNSELRTHLQTCPSCSGLVSDLELIAREARQLAECDEPAPRVWVRIAAELRAEGLIREPEAAPLRPVLVSPSRKRAAWWLIPVAAALLAFGGYFVGRRSATDQEAHKTPQVFQVPNAVSVGTDQAAEDQQFLDEVSQHAPMMRATYENELRSVNAYIHDTQTYVEQNPGDSDARRLLDQAQHQKAMLYQMALDHVQ